jgi:hypothetical protein
MSAPHNQPAYASRAEFGIGHSDDGSGFHTSVGYNLSDEKHWAPCIRIGGDYNVTVPVEHANALIAAIRYCADAINAKATGEETNA